MSYLSFAELLEDFVAPQLASLPEQWDRLISQLHEQRRLSALLYPKLTRIQFLLVRQNFTEARQRLLELYDSWSWPIWLHWLGLCAQAAGDLEAAYAWLRQEQDQLASGDAGARTDNAQALAGLALQKGLYVEAGEHLRTALLQARLAGDQARERRLKHLFSHLEQGRPQTLAFFADALTVLDRPQADIEPL